MTTAPPRMDATALPPMDVAGRLPRLREAMASEDVDSLVVTNLTNVRYLTGFTGSAGVLWVGSERTVLVTDGRYETQSAEQLAAAGVDAGIEIGPAPRQVEIGASLPGAGDRRIGLEAAHVTWAGMQTFAEKWFPGAEILPTTALVERLRRVKDAGEIARVGQAAAIADQALARVRGRLDEIESGAVVTELDFAIELDFAMKRLGADEPSFATIVASGPNSAKPHHRPSPRAIGRGEPVVLDFGARVDGYCSDMTRTVWSGELQADMRPIVTLVADSQAAGVAAIVAGAEARSVDQACRDLIAGAGYGDRFVHGTGHGVGIDIHEAPAVASTSLDTLSAGHIVTVEPGVYLPGQGGVRIEDTLVVTGAGCYPLTTTPKDMPD